MVEHTMTVPNRIGCHAVGKLTCIKLLHLLGGQLGQRDATERRDQVATHHRFVSFVRGDPATRLIALDPGGEIGAHRLPLVERLEPLLTVLERLGKRTCGFLAGFGKEALPHALSGDVARLPASIRSLAELPSFLPPRVGIYATSSL